MLNMLRGLLHEVRAIPGREFGLRPYTVEIVTVSPVDGSLGGAKTESSVTITEGGGQPPKVRWLGEDDLELHQLTAGAIEIGPVTPHNGTVGTLLATLEREPDRRQKRYVRLTGPAFPNGARFAIRHIVRDNPLRYMLRVEHKPD